MRRKYLAALLALVIMLVSAAGCGSAKENNDAPQMRVGVLTAVNLTSEEFSSALQNRDFSVRLTAGQGGAAFEYEDSLRERHKEYQRNSISLGEEPTIQPSCLPVIL